MNSQQPQRVVIQYTRPYMLHICLELCFSVPEYFVRNLLYSCWCLSVCGCLVCRSASHFRGTFWICYYVITGRNVQGRTESQVFYVTGVPSAPAMPYTSQTEFMTKSATTTGTAGHASTTSCQLLTQQRVQIPDNPQSPTAGSCPLNNQLPVYLGEPPPSYESIVYQSEVNISASATPSPPPVEEMG